MHALKLRGISKIGIYKKFNIFHDGIYSIFYRRQSCVYKEDQHIELEVT